MPLDSLTLRALALELDRTLRDVKIDKIHMPRPREAVLATRPGRLLLGPNGVYFTALKDENPDTPPMLCMLLRKHLVGGRILSVTQPGRERILVLTVLSSDELGIPRQKKLVCELMGSRTNLLLLDQDDTILGCVSRSEGDAKRAVLPGLRYRLPEPPEKPDFFAQTSFDTTDPDRLLDRYSVLSPVLARHCAARCSGPEALADYVSALWEGPFVPVAFHNGKKQDFYCLPLENTECVKHDSFSELLDTHFAEKRKAESKKALTAALSKTVQNARARLSRKLEKQQLELQEAQGREALKRQADLITANLYAIRPGDTRARVVDYYDPEMPTVELTLQPDKTPQQNAQALFKKYTRLKNADEALTAQILAGRQELEYLDSVLYALGEAAGEKEMAAIREELLEGGYIRRTDKTRKKVKDSFAPREELTEDGFRILVGRNNKENEELTLRRAGKNDLWFHARNIPGSHVVLFTEGREVSDAALLRAAQLAAAWSSGKNQPKLPVDYTTVRQVKKLSGGKPGMVNYYNYQTILVEPKA